MPACPNQFLFSQLKAQNPALSCLQDPNVSLEALNAIAQAQDCPVRFCATPARGALDYERRIVHEGRVHTRIHTWHDRFNAGMWLCWPHTKLSISKAHLQAAGKERSNTRNRRRDALTLLDEVGVIIQAEPEIEALHRAHHWQAFFWEKRELWFQCIHPLFLGHGLAEQCLSPYLGLTGKALYLHPSPQDPRSADLRLAEYLADPSALNSPRQLCPFPLLGTPSWHPDNHQPAFYRNHNYFRPKSQRLSSPQ